MNEQIQEIKMCLDNHITESGYYREGVARDQKATSESLKSLEKKMDELLEVYTAANFLKKFAIGAIGIAGTITAMIYAWLHILKKS